ncbi:cytochrome c [Thermus sp.]|uniref:c-type cytochrome n=1 Tax=Thermus sp. TaxID=275 RepID=UPI0025FCCCB4|nr:cytochrome c [Thermus sp.]MCS6869181.1 cytochrome c [Thermus sp.]MDW8358311.1 cytochrome c [Thermus sp.]
MARKAAPWLPTVLLLALALALGQGGPQAQPKAPSPQAQQLELGKQTYQKHCASCHDQGALVLVGKDPLNRLTRYRTAKGLFDYLTIAMPPTNPGGLKDEEYWALIAFILAENKILPPDVVVGQGNGAQIPIRPPGP